MCSLMILLNARDEALVRHAHAKMPLQLGQAALFICPFRLDRLVQRAITLAHVDVIPLDVEIALVRVGLDGGKGGVTVEAPACPRLTEHTLFH